MKIMSQTPFTLKINLYKCTVFMTLIRLQIKRISIQFYNQYNQMKGLIIILALIVLLQGCHYSCFNCTGPQYMSCLSCTNNGSVSVVQDPNTTPAVYWSSVYQTGTCVDTMGPAINPLGIVLFAVLSIICVVTATKESFYLFFTIQTFGLYNLVDIAWVNPLGYLLQSMQHLMIWNIIGSKFKTSDYTFITNKYYRLNVYLRQAQIGPNIILIAVFTLLSLLLLIVICIVAVRRKKQADLKQEKQDRQRIIFQNVGSEQKKQIKQNPQQKPTCMQWFSEKVLIQVAKFLLSVLYLMVQETSLVLLVGLLFKLSSFIIVLSVIYLHILIFTMSYAYYYRVEYFKQKNVMYVNFAKKVVLPIMVVVPLKAQYLLFLFAAIIIVVQCIIDCYNGLYKKLNRLAFYKAVQLLIIGLLIIYYLTQTSGNSYSSSKAAAVACTFAIAFYLILFVAVELPIGIKERFFSKKLKNQNDNQSLNEKLQNPIQQTLNDYNGQKNQTFEVVQMVSSSSKRNNNDSYLNDMIQIEKPQQKNTREDNSSIKQSFAGQNKAEEIEVPKPTQPARKKRRKQILDKQLRMRYGI